MGHSDYKYAPRSPGASGRLQLVLSPVLGSSSTSSWPPTGSNPPPPSPPALSSPLQPLVPQPYPPAPGAPALGYLLEQRYQLLYIPDSHQPIDPYRLMPAFFLCFLSENIF